MEDRGYPSSPTTADTEPDHRRLLATPIKESAVLRAVNYNAKVVDEILKLVSTLSDRLAPVLQPENDRDPSLESEVPHSGVIIATEINNTSERANAAASRLVDLLDRLAV